MTRTNEVKRDVSERFIDKKILEKGKIRFFFSQQKHELMEENDNLSVF